jgi:large conductance mechanosensitive channel
VIKEFKEFAFRGNMLDLAIGVVIGAAFGAVVNSFAQDVLMNLVASFFGKPDYSQMTWEVGKGTVAYGKFLTAALSFLLVAFALFFVVKAINRVMGPKDAPSDPPNRRECPYCGTSIPVVATRCLACTSQVEPVTT